MENWDWARANRMNNEFDFEDVVRKRVREIANRNSRSIDGEKFALLLQCLFEETMDQKTHKGRPNLITDEMVVRTIDRIAPRK